MDLGWILVVVWPSAKCSLPHDPQHRPQRTEEGQPPPSPATSRFWDVRCKGEKVVGTRWPFLVQTLDQRGLELSLGCRAGGEQSCLRCTSLPQVRPSVEGHPKKGNHNHAIFYYPNQIPRLCPLAKSQANEWSSGDRQGSAQLGVPRPTRRGYKYLSVFLGFPPARPHPELSPSFPPRGG